MVKVGFIVEGTSDFVILKSDRFQNLLKYELNIENDESLIHIAGNKTKLKENYISLVKSLKNKGVGQIFTLVDQDDKEAQKKNQKYEPPDCPIIVVNEIKSFGDNKNYPFPENCFVVMTREMEAWFLADEELGLHCNGNPEEILNPSELVEEQLRTSCHVKIANRVKDKFSLERAAENSQSAFRFYSKLHELGQENNN